MWNRHFKYLLVRFGKSSRNPFFLPIALPLWILADIVEDLSDLIAVVLMLTPPKVPARTTIHSLRQVTKGILLLLKKSGESESFELLDIQTPDFSIHVKLR